MWLHPIEESIDEIVNAIDPGNVRERVRGRRSKFHCYYGLVFSMLLLKKYKNMRI
jgi:hypothetical protein